MDVNFEKNEWGWWRIQKGWEKKEKLLELEKTKKTDMSVGKGMKKKKLGSDYSRGGG